MKICLRCIAALLLFACALPIGCALENDPPVGSALNRDIANYMQYNAYVLDALDCYYAGALPAQVEQKNVRDYCDWYQCALLGDPNFSIYLSLQFDAIEDYQAEIARIEALIDPETNASISDAPLFLRGSAQDIQEILNDQILDGLFYRFELVQCNESMHRIDLYAAQIWDGSATDAQKEILQQFAK